MFPPMPTKWYKSTALCIGTALIVARGTTGNLSSLKTIEVMSTETEQWSTAADLPKPQSYAPAAICGEHIYILRESVMYTFHNYPHPIPQIISSKIKELQRYQSMEGNSYTTRQQYCLCIHLWSTANNWWEGFRQTTYCSHSHVWSNHWLLGGH